MKKLYSVLVLFCWLTPSAFSQVRPQQQEGSLETIKIGFITNRLNLTPDEAQKFWPIYQVYSGEVRKAYSIYRVDQNELGLQENLLNIRKKYSVEFLKAITPPKINDFFRAEKDFNAYVQRERQRRLQMQGRRFPPGN